MKHLEPLHFSVLPESHIMFFFFFFVFLFFKIGVNFTILFLFSCIAAQNLCPDEGSFTSGGSLVSTSGGTCSRQIYASCIVNCPSGEIRTVSCNPDYNWNDPDPCIGRYLSRDMTKPTK